MKKIQSQLTPSERQLTELVSESTLISSPSSTLLSILGASGTGKTTATKSLVPGQPTFVERNWLNPHWKYLLTGDERFDAFRNQKWFLQQIRNFLEAHDTAAVLVVDQDPVAISMVYGRLFLESGRIGATEFEALIAEQIAIEKGLQRRNCRRMICYLHSRPSIMVIRAAKRDPATDLGIEWFQELHSRFEALAASLPLAASIDTGITSVMNMAARVDQIRNNIQESLRSN